MGGQDRIVAPKERPVHRQVRFIVVAVGVMLGAAGGWVPGVALVLAAGAEDRAAPELAKEVAAKGWIVFSATSQHGDWDLWLARPDGSMRKNVNNTAEWNEAGARFSPDGQRMLYYRMPRAVAVDNNSYGTHELVLARSDGSQPVVLGKELWWAAWGPDAKTLAVLAKRNIEVIEIDARRVLRSLPRQGIVQQLGWSADGKWFCGTANGLGEVWAIGRMDAQTGRLNAVSDTDCYNCTPDWLPDSRQILYSKGLPRTEGWAQLWIANADGSRRRMLYGEIGRHIYGGAASPDGKYLLFTRSEQDLGRVDNSQTTMALMRLADAPIVGGPSAILRKQYPKANSGPVLDLGPGWEPHWSYAAQPR
jgi:Tol biopolymer transport system component